MAARGKHPDTAFIIYDVESIVDGALISKVLYSGEGLEPDAAIDRLRAELSEKTGGADPFVPVSFHVPVSIGVARIGRRYELQELRALDAPRYDSREMVSLFWRGIETYEGATLVDFNGRGFDIPLLTLSAFRFGISCPRYFKDPERFGFRYRFTDKHVDLLEWLTEYGAFRLKGGLNLLAKMLGKPGKMDTRGDQVDALHREGRLQDINDYCLHDVLDTYFVFLRTRVLTGEISIDDEQAIVSTARDWIAGRVSEQPALEKYLENFGEWNPAPFV